MKYNNEDLKPGDVVVMVEAIGSGNLPGNTPNGAIGVVEKISRGVVHDGDPNFDLIQVSGEMRNRKFFRYRLHKL